MAAQRITESTCANGFKYKTKRAVRAVSLTISLRVYMGHILSERNTTLCRYNILCHITEYIQCNLQELDLLIMEDSPFDERAPQIPQTNQCPSCKSINTAKILYGMPDFNDKLEESLESGRVVLGGCTIMDKPSIRHCNDCGENY